MGRPRTGRSRPNIQCSTSRGWQGRNPHRASPVPAMNIPAGDCLLPHNRSFFNGALRKAWTLISIRPAPLVGLYVESRFPPPAKGAGPFQDPAGPHHFALGTKRPQEFRSGKGHQFIRKRSELAGPRPVSVGSPQGGRLGRLFKPPPGFHRLFGSRNQGPEIQRPIGPPDSHPEAVSNGRSLEGRGSFPWAGVYKRAGPFPASGGPDQSSINATRPDGHSIGMRIIRPFLQKNGPLRPIGNVIVAARDGPAKFESFSPHLRCFL